MACYIGYPFLYAVKPMARNSGHVMRSSFKKYLNSRVPRYTSYPTALQFTDAVGEDVYKAWLGAVKADQTLSLYVHVPFCEQLCYL